MRDQVRGGGGAGVQGVEWSSVAGVSALEEREQAAEDRVFQFWLHQGEERQLLGQDQFLELSGGAQEGRRHLLDCSIPQEQKQREQGLPTEGWSGD